MQCNLILLIKFRMEYELQSCIQHDLRSISFHVFFSPPNQMKHTRCPLIMPMMILQHR
ncbi:hypothetical protein C0J52_13611 [Blattella germanica]|nr:hypothetical protein C0J52_13611 [Blattella germanica]